MKVHEKIIYESKLRCRKDIKNDCRSFYFNLKTDANICQKEANICNKDSDDHSKFPVHVAVI